MRSNHERSELLDTFLGGIMRLGYEERSGAGAASLKAIVSRWTSTGAAQVVTLADGEQGQVKIFIHEVDGGEVTLTPANFGGASSATVTMVTAGDCVAFIFLGASWWLLWSTANVEGTPLVIA